MPKIGFLFNPRALWIGVHYSSFNKRLCINVLPCLTLYFVAAGGNPPCAGKL